MLIGCASQCGDSSHEKASFIALCVIRWRIWNNLSLIKTCIQRISESPTRNSLVVCLYATSPINQCWFLPMKKILGTTKHLDGIWARFSLLQTIRSTNSIEMSTTYRYPAPASNLHSIIFSASKNSCLINENCNWLPLRTSVWWTKTKWLPLYEFRESTFL